MADSDQKQPSVIFDANTIKKNYIYGEELIVSFVLYNYEACDNDIIGVFDVDAISSDQPCSSKHVSSSGECCVELTTDFKSNAAAAFELRYVNQDKEVLGRSSPFTIIEEIETQESLITVHEGIFSSDDSLVFIDKISPNSPSGLKVDDIVLDTQESTMACESFDADLDGRCSDKSVSCNIMLAVETNRREAAEKTVEKLSRTLGTQMNFIDKENKDKEKLEIERNRLKTMNGVFQEDLNLLQEGVDLLDDELGDTRTAAKNLQVECVKYKKKLKEEEHLTHQLKVQILDDRQEHKEEMHELNEQVLKKMQSMEKAVVRLEEVLESERNKNTVLKEELETLKVDYEFAMNEKNEELIQVISKVEDLGKDLEYEHEANKLKLQEQTETHEKIINRLESELKKEVESKSTISREYEKTIRELESRVVNESTIASRTENDLASAENRCKEAKEDIMYFRQKLLETEQKLQVNQRQLSKANEEVNALRSMVSCDIIDTMSVMSDTTVDDKSTVCESSSVSASTSIENFSIDRRRQLDMTDYTDDENSWYNASVRSQSMESFPVAQFSSVGASAAPFSPSKVAGLIQIKRRSPTGEIEIDTNFEQKISVVESRRPTRKSRRKYGRPIDLTPSSSVTSVVSDRPNEFNALQPYNHQQQMMFSKNIVELDRPTLEKQYVAIRQHRNSLIRENSYLRNKCNGLKQNLFLSQNNYTNLHLEAEHKIAMLLMALHNQECVASQDLQALMQMFPVPCNPPQFMSPQYTQGEDTNNTNNGYLSPYAPEYKPMYQSMPPCSSMYIQNDPMQYIDYRQDGNGYLMSVPSQLPETPIPQEDLIIDASDQLAAIGVPLLKTTF